MKILVIGTGSMGRGGDLLYWAPILEKMVESVGVLLLWLSHTHVNKLSNSIKIIQPFEKINFFGFNILSFNFFFKLIKIKPDVIVVSEYGLISLYCVFYGFFRKNVKLVQLVENTPSFLVGYGTNRSNRFFVKYRKFISNRMSSILVSNVETKDYLIADLQAVEEKILVGPYLTSISSRRRLKDRLVDGGVIEIVTVGQLIPRKGFLGLISEFLKIPVNIRSRFNLKIIGDGPDRLNLLNFVNSNNLKNVEIVGPKPYSEIGEFLRNSDVFLLPTHADYRSLVMFEALTAGLVIVGSKYDGASREVVREGLNGYIYDPKLKGDLERVLSILNRESIDKMTSYSISISDGFSVESAANNICNAIFKSINK